MLMNMKAEVEKSEPLDESEESELYQQFLKMKPTYSSNEEARLAFTKELQAMADARYMSVDELFWFAENNSQWTEEISRSWSLRA